MRILLSTLLLLAPLPALAQAQTAPAEQPAQEAVDPETPASEVVPEEETETPPIDPEARKGVTPKVDTVPAPGEEVTEPTREAFQMEELEEGKIELPWSPFVDTRLTFAIADSNLLAAPGETLEPSPGLQFQATDRNNLFFENYDTKDSGFESLTHLVLYREMPTYFDRLTAEVALVIRLDVDPSDLLNNTFRLRDSSSYVRLRYQPLGWGDAENVDFTGFPVRSDRFRLGYSYRITWGGDDIFLLPRLSSVPGARFGINRDRWYAWVGGKSTVKPETVEGLTEQNTELVSNYGLLGAAGVDLTENLRVEANGGFFTRGTFAEQALRGEKVYAGGASAQVAWHVGRPVGTSIDLRLYRNDPFEHQAFFRPESYGGPVSYVVKSEITYVTQTLADPENVGSTTMQGSFAGDVNAAVKFGLNRLFLDAVYQDLGFILLNVPSFVPYQDFTDAMNANPEMFASLGYDHYIESLHLTPGIRFGILRPAHVITDRLTVGTNPPEVLTGERAVVVRDAFTRAILPPDESVVPVYAVQGTARLDLSDAMAILGEVYYENDRNLTTFAETVAGDLVAVFDDPDRLGFNVVVQARF